jgi:outer membrane receptor protein involved in Fe transport
LNQDIKPEKTAVSELELGFKINENMFLTSNIFNIIIKNPIVYSWNPDTEEEAYINYTKTGTKGVEAQFIAKYYKWSLNVGYSFYSAKNMNEVIPYQVDFPAGTINEEALKGNPQHKISLIGSYNFTENISVSPTFIYLGERYGFINSNTEQSKQDATLLINLNLTFQNLFVKNLSLSIGAYNLSDQKYGYIQPSVDSNMAEALYPAPPREFILKLNYWF